MYDSSTIANYFLYLAQQEGNSITPMKLQKLVYFAHGYYLAITGYPLVDDEVQAWQYGPVIPSLYQSVKQYGGNPIIGFIKSSYHTTEKLSVEPIIKTFLEKIWEVYGHLHAIQLSKMTHQPGSPWAIVWGEYGVPYHTEIPQELIKEYFRKKINKNG